MIDLTKSCKICNVIKEVNMFDKGRRYCKECRKQKNHKYYEKNKTYWQLLTKTDYERLVYDFHKYERQCAADYKMVDKLFAKYDKLLARKILTNSAVTNISPPS